MGQGVGGVLVTFRPDAGGETRQVFTADDGTYLAHLESGCYVVVAALDRAAGQAHACVDVDLVLQLEIAEPPLQEPIGIDTIDSLAAN